MDPTLGLSVCECGSMISLLNIHQNSILAKQCSMVRLSISHSRIILSFSPIWKVWVKTCRRIKKEFDAYLTYGRLEQGFLRVHCEECHHKRLVALAVKKRGFCPSCGVRRRVESAALLIDDVLPDEPVRQLLPWMACSRAMQEQRSGVPRVISFALVGFSLPAGIMARRVFASLLSSSTTRAYR